MSTDSKRASEEALDNLHAELANTLAKGVREIKKILTPNEEGALEIKGAAAMLNVARQFLKDNGVEAEPTPKSPLGNLTDELPFTDENPSDRPPH